MLTTATVTPRELMARTKRIAADVASKHAADVDANSRFPTETFAAAREAQLLSAAVPTELGGAGCSLTELTEMWCMARTMALEPQAWPSV